MRLFLIIFAFGAPVLFAEPVYAQDENVTSLLVTATRAFHEEVDTTRRLFLSLRGSPWFADRKQITSEITAEVARRLGLEVLPSLPVSARGCSDTPDPTACRDADAGVYASLSFPEVIGDTAIIYVEAFHAWRGIRLEPEPMIQRILWAVKAFRAGKAWKVVQVNATEMS
jgi:hypothetical protein